MNNNFTADVHFKKFSFKKKLHLSTFKKKQKKKKQDNAMRWETHHSEMGKWNKIVGKKQLEKLKKWIPKWKVCDKKIEWKTCGKVEYKTNKFRK